MKTGTHWPRRHFLRLAGGAGALSWLTACDRLKDLKASLPLGPGADTLVPFKTPSGYGPDLISHTLNRLTWGAAPGEYARVSALGSTPEDCLERFLEEQLQPEKIEDPATRAVLARLEAVREPMTELFEYKPSQLDSELTRAAVIRASHSRRQLYEVMVGFWSDHFNIDSSKLDCRWFKTVDDRDIIRKHALGNFRSLLRASALSPAMLFYLDGRENKHRAAGDKPNENYARELLELHTLGIHGGYTQRDVMEAARCLTGWTVTGREVKLGIGRVFFEAAAHDPGAKSVLGREIPAGGGPEDLDRLLAVITAHSSTAAFIARKLCRHFIADEPPNPAVEKVAAAFQSSAGDIPETLRALFRTEEFRTLRGNKIKRPFHFIVSALRATGSATSCGTGVRRALQVMGHAPFHYPTPEGPPASGADWLATLLCRWDFASQLAGGSLKCTRTDTAGLTACAGGRDGLLRHLFGRDPDTAECAAAAGVNSPLALAL
ncbi:MAG: DUF1800 domain-containing protein, partial [Verrucomicrobiaceae bacterium]